MITIIVSRDYFIILSQISRDLYAYWSRAADTSRLFPNLIVIPLFFNRRTYPTVSVSKRNRQSTRRQTQLPTNLFSLHACFPDKYRFPGAGPSLDIIALLRKPVRRVPAVLLICLVYSLPAREREHFGSSRRGTWISSLKLNLYDSLSGRFWNESKLDERIFI